MALVHTVVLKPRAVIADAIHRLRQRPLAFWVVGAISQLPDLHRTSAEVPTDMDGLLAAMQNPATLQQLNTAAHDSVKWGIVGGVLSALIWPVVTLLTQDVAVDALFGLAMERLLVATKAFLVAIGMLFALTAALLAPALLAFVVGHHHGQPWTSLPGIEASGFWLIASLDIFVTLLLVSLMLGAFIVVPAEACTRPDTARRVVERSWRMSRDYLMPITGLLTWLAVIYGVVSIVTWALGDETGVGRLLTWVIDGGAATIAPLCGASLHQTLSENADRNMPS